MSARLREQTLRAAPMKEGSQLTNSTQITRIRRKRGRTNFIGLKQRRLRELKKKYSLGANGSRSPRKPSRSHVDGQGQSWRLGCKI